MGRRKIEIKPIKDDRNRSVTFLKRKGGLFKKAHELSVLCQVDVAVIIFGSNKKLYQYSSGDIQEIISRHSYYDAAHEHRTPMDYKDKNLQDDDDDDDMGGPERAGSHSSADHSMPHHLQHQHPSLHLNNRHTASASPPNMPKTMVGTGPYPMGRVGTPQPPMTRPSSRNQMQRRNSSNLVPANAYPASQPPQTNGAYAYSHMPAHSSVYQPPQQAQMMPMQPANINQLQGYQFAHQQQTQAQAQAEAFISETNRRQSMPPTFSQEHATENEPPRIDSNQQPQAPEKRAPAKSRSMYTPIGPSESMLAQHFGFGQDAGRSHSVDVGSIQRKNAAGAPPKKEEKPTVTTSAPTNATAPAPAPINTSPPPPPPSRNNSMADPKSAGMRPKLKVHIPTEEEEAASPADSSPRNSSATAGNASARPEGGPVVLPPPSPSVSAILSAGATGPTNPFSRPPPASSAPEQTPMSALPSRFTESILPSPSAFYGDWALPFPQRNGGGDNLLPSPLNFQTPVAGNSQNAFKDAVEGNNKRRSPGSDHSDGSAPKRVKT